MENKEILPSINPNKLYKFEIKLSPGIVIEIEKGNRKDGTPIVLANTSDASFQFFKLRPKGENYVIESLIDKNKVIDVYWSRMENGNKIHLYKKNNTKAQEFKLVDAGDGYISILSSINNDYCLDVPHSQTKLGTKIWLYRRNFTDAQKFKLIGKNFINQSLEYAQKYSLERNPDYESKEDNSTNFCSQCLVAGGIDQDEIWKKGEESFFNSDKFKEYFINKKIEWKANPVISEIKPGDVIFCKENKKSNFAKTIFVMRTSVKNVVFCSNSKDLCEEYLDINFIEGLLKTSCLFK